MNTKVIDLQPSAKAAEIFRAKVNKPNFMTPDLIGHYLIKGGAAELTSGRFLDRKLYGVTVVRNGAKDDTASKAFSDEQEAKDYIIELKK